MSIIRTIINGIFGVLKVCIIITAFFYFIESGLLEYVLDLF